MQPGSTISLSDHLSLNYTGSFAHQTDTGDNPVKYSANYYLADVSVGKRNLGRIGGSYEVLGSDNGEAVFQTPLATLHAFQGWADVFLAPPVAGLEDISFYISGEMAWNTTATVRHHWFYLNDGDDFIGSEINASLAKRVNNNLAFLIKYARFSGKNEIADVSKFWFQMEIGF